LFVCCIFLGLFALVALRCSELWFEFIPVGFAVGLVFIGIYLIVKRNSPLPNKAKWVMGLFFALLVLLPLLLDLNIRQERKALQERARIFLARPIPKLLIPNSKGEVGGYFVDTNGGIANGVFGYSRVLIERYAAKVRIRWSAAIQGEFACTGDNCLNGNISGEVTSIEEVRRYSAESHAILSEEWQMGYWQFIEDSIEFKSVIPEIAEEDQMRILKQ